MFQEMSDVAKETLAVLKHFESNLIEKIPMKFLNYLNELALNSKCDIYIDLEKELVDQNISEESKDLIALIYYSYIADEEEKKQIVKLWDENEKKYVKELEEKFDSNNIFKDRNKNINNLPIKVRKRSLLDKIIALIRKVFNN